MTHVTEIPSTSSRGVAGAPRATAQGAPGPPPPKRPSRFSASQLAATAFLAPLIVYLVVFYAYPLYRNVDLSIRDYTLRSFITGDADFVGFDTYRSIFASSTFSAAVRNTAIFTLGSIVFQFVIGLVLAVFFRGTFRLNGVLRALFLVPWLLPLIVSASTWSWMLNSDNGVVNSVMQAFGLGSINWLTDPSTALISVTIANIWLGIPFNLVILYSGLQNIPDDLYEAASLDGATAWNKFWFITVPMLRPVMAITLLLGLVYTLKVVDVIWVMTAGGPADASTTLATWSYREAFGTGLPELSPAAAIGNLLILVALAAGLAYIAVQRREQARS